MRAWLLLFGLAGCTRGGDDTAPAYDTGWFSAIGPDGRCVDRVLGSMPGEGEVAWYHRRGPELSLNTRQRSAYRLRVLDADGLETAVQTELIEEGEDKARLVASLAAPLRPDTDHQLELTDCEGTRVVPFRTSAFGLPLADAPGSLAGKTYVFDMSRARWIEPANFGVVMSLYFTTPVLVGVQYAGSAGLDLLGGMGLRGTDGSFRQGIEPTWDFPLADFSAAPWFEATTSKVTVTAEGAEIDIHDFRLAGTFSADGTRLGGVEISGLGDTRLMGELVGRKGEEDAICDLAATWGVACEPCPDGRATCMRLSAIEAYGEIVPGLQLRPIAP